MFQHRLPLTPEQLLRIQAELQRLGQLPPTPPLKERARMTDLPTKSQIRRLIDINTPPGYEHDRMVVIGFMPFYSIPPPFSTELESAQSLQRHIEEEHGIRIRAGSDGGRIIAYCTAADGDTLRCEGKSEAHAITNVALWWLACYRCENDEG